MRFLHFDDDLRQGSVRAQSYDCQREHGDVHMERDQFVVHETHEGGETHQGEDAGGFEQLVADLK